MTGKFKILANDMDDFAVDYGACIATNKITVDGQRVGFMYREAPDNDVDSGWRFLAATESDAYLHDANNLAVHDVQTIADCDPDIVPFLDAPFGSAFKRADGDAFVEVEFRPPPDSERAH